MVTAFIHAFRDIGYATWPERFRFGAAIVFLALALATPILPAISKGIKQRMSPDKIKGWLTLLVVITVFLFSAIILLPPSNWKFHPAGDHTDKVLEIACPIVKCEPENLTQQQRFVWTWRRVAAECETTFDTLPSTYVKVEEGWTESDGSAQSVFRFTINDQSLKKKVQELQPSISISEDPKTIYDTLNQEAENSMATFLSLLASDVNRLADDKIPLREKSDDLPLKLLFLYDLKQIHSATDGSSPELLSLTGRDSESPLGKAVSEFTTAMRKLESSEKLSARIEHALSELGKWKTSNGKVVIPTSSGYAMAYLRWYDVLLNAARSDSTNQLQRIEASDAEGAGLESIQLFKNRVGTFTLATPGGGDNHIDGSIAAYPLFASLVLFDLGQTGKNLVNNVNVPSLGKQPLGSVDGVPPLPVLMQEVCDRILTQLQDGEVSPDASDLAKNEWTTSTSFNYSKGNPHDTLVGTASLYYTVRAVSRLMMLHDDIPKKSREQLARDAVQYLLAASTCLNSTETADGTFKYYSKKPNVVSDGYAYCYLMRAQISMAKAYARSGLPELASLNLKNAAFCAAGLHDNSIFSLSVTVASEKKWSCFYRPIAHSGAVRQLGSAIRSGYFESPSSDVDKKRHDIMRTAYRELHSPTASDAVHLDDASAGNPADAK